MSFMDAVKKLRDKTSAGMMECSAALKEAGGDIEKAIDVLRKKGISKAAKKSTRAASQGVIDTYIHLGNKIGVLVEVNCETDFVARNDDFKMMVKEIAMQIAASNPIYVSRNEVDPAAVEREKDIFRTQITGKPANVIEKIVEGKLDKYFSEVCLLEQPYIKDPNIKIQDLITQVISKIGENIVVRRFVRYQVGEEA